MRTSKSMPKDWVSSPLTKWLINNNVTLNKVTVGTNLSPSVVHRIIKGQTLQPEQATIQKLCAFTGLSRAQFGHHIAAVRRARTPVDKAVVAKGTAQRMIGQSKKLSKPINMLQSNDELISAIHSLEGAIRKAFRV